MANSLLDFVMSVVRDPDAAAHYAANPAQAIADANLTDVTSADVNHLIPVVAESLSTAVPSTGFDSFDGDAGGNVWASGAATAAFDAFGDHLPEQGADDAHTLVSNVVDTHDDLASTGIDGIDGGDDPSAAGAVPTVALADDPSLHFDGPVIDDLPVHDAASAGRLGSSGDRRSPPAARRPGIRHLQLARTLHQDDSAAGDGRAVVVSAQLRDAIPSIPRESPNPLMGAPPKPLSGMVERGVAAPFQRGSAGP